LLGFSLAAFAASFLLVVMGEMGDKTQFLAMSLATRYNAFKVLFAIFLATVANFAIVVVIAQFLTTIVPLYVISVAASLSFIGFGLWMLRPEKTQENIKKFSQFGVIGAVGISFFIAEFGDRTQLATISLAAEYQNALSVLIGATLGMLVADAVAIGVGVVLGKHIPQRTVKWLSATIFMIFGLTDLYEVLSAKIGLAYAALFLVVAIVFCILVAMLITRKKKPKET
jgi:putative Ca2+/H+ antiporter (TMEM165/GDT1 family)